MITFMTDVIATSATNMQSRLTSNALTQLAKNTDLIGSKLIETTNALLITSTGKKMGENLLKKLRKADFSSKNTQLAILKSITAVAFASLALQTIFPCISYKIVETLIVSTFTSLAIRYAIEANEHIKDSSHKSNN